MTMIEPEGRDLAPGSQRNTVGRGRPEIDITRLCTLLSLVRDSYPGADVLPDEARRWTPAERVEVARWAGAVHLSASDNDDVKIPGLPAVLAARRETKTVPLAFDDAVVPDELPRAEISDDAVDAAVAAWSDVCENTNSPLMNSAAMRAALTAALPKLPISGEVWLPDVDTEGPKSLLDPRVGEALMLARDLLRKSQFLAATIPPKVEDLITLADWILNQHAVWSAGWRDLDPLPDDDTDGDTDEEVEARTDPELFD